jgi:hypothetical protein
MANRSFLPPLGHLEVDVVELFGTITIGASGAVSASSGKGIASVVKETAAGQYTITLSDRYNSLLFASAVVLDDTNSDPVTVGIQPRLLSQDVNNATPTVAIQFYDHTDGSAANPASGAVVYVSIKVRNSSVS